MRRLFITITISLLLIVSGLAGAASLQDSQGGFRNISVSGSSVTADISGTANQIIITDNGDGTITISAPQDLHTGATPTWAALKLTDTNASNTLSFVWNEDDTVDRILNFLVTSANRSITIEGDTLLDQDLTTDSTPTFGAQFTLNGADPAIIFDGSTASDTDFWIGLTADEVGDDNDDLQIGKGTAKGTTPFFIWDKDGGFIAQNLTDAVTGYQFMDADGGTPVLNIDTTNERVGVGIASLTQEFEVNGTDTKILVQGSIAAAIALEDNGFANDPVFAWQSISGRLRLNYEDDAPTSNVDLLTVLSDGKTGYGTFSPDTILEASTDSADTIITVSTYDDDATELPELNLRKADGTEASPALVDDNDVLGVVSFSGYDGSGFHEGARIEGRIDGTPSDGTDMPTELTFWTTPDGTATGVQHASIGPSGAIQFQNSTDSVTGFQILDFDGGTPIFNVDTVGEFIGVGTADPDGFQVEVAVSETLQGTDNIRFGIDTGTPRMLFEEDGGSIWEMDNFAGDFRWFTPGVSRFVLDANGNNGFSVADPDTKVEILNAGDQLKLSFDGTDNAVFAVDTNGDMTVTVSGDEVKSPKINVLGAGTNHDGYVIRDAGEVQTTDATVTTVDSFTLSDNNTYLVKASVTGFEDGASYAGYEIIATVFRDGGGATILGGVTSVHTTETVGAWDATFTVNSNDVRVSVTGEAATTIEWSCTMQFMNVGI